MVYPSAPLPPTDLDGRGLRIGIVIARYNWHITGTMLALAQEELVRPRHDVVVGDAAAHGIQQVALSTGVPIIFGVMCAENQQQAQERVDRGRECAQAVVEMAQTIQKLKSKTDRQED